MEEKNKEKKEVSNKKTIILLIITVILLIILGIIYAEVFCNNNGSDIVVKKGNLIPKGNQNISNSNNSILKNSKEWKPIIYIYPEQETKVTVKLGRPENLTHTYPKYENGWEVTAKPNGDLVDCKTGRNLYALYWEGINTVEPNMEEGFVVKGKDTIKFLEEKLEILGLNQREANEFIIYWLPKLESNKYNFIRFQKEEEINNNMPLEITPKPDTIIRVVMEYKALEESTEVKEQQLETPKRTGYTVVEWGGTEIK